MERNAKNPIVTISILASKRPDTIRRCLDSLKPLREAVDSELILVDTSKNAVIHKILLEYTDLVYEFEWCNDFAKARNEGLKRAQGEWFFFLDDDEWFEDMGDLIDFFKSGEYKKYGFANHRVRSFSDSSFNEYTDNWVSRLIRIGRETRFVGKVHEQFAPLDGKCKELEVISLHSGYVFENEEQRRAHFERNMSILQDVLKEEMTTLRWKVQALMEYASIQDWDSVVEISLDCINKTKKKLPEYEKRFFVVFYAAYIRVLYDHGQYEEVLKVCKQAYEDERVLEVLKAFISFSRAKCFYKLGRLDNVEDAVNKYLNYCTMMKKQPKKLKSLQQIVLLHNTFDDIYVKEAYSLLIASDAKRGRTSALHKYYNRIRKDMPDLFMYKEMELALLELMASVEYDSIFTYVAKDVYENKALRDYICDVIKLFEENDSVGFEKIMYVYEQAGFSEWCTEKFAIKKELYSKQEMEGASQPQDEMQMLRDQIMVQVKGFIANGQYQVALDIIKQLKQMLPNDEEIKFLELEVKNYL